MAPLPSSGCWWRLTNAGTRPHSESYRSVQNGASPLPAQVARGGQLLEDAAVLLDDELRGGEDVLAHAPPEADVLKEEEGLAVELLSREELFITSKLFPQSYPYVQCGKDIDATLKRLGADYLDLLLFHQPYGEYVSGWKVMEEAVAAGTLRAIGLSDFCPERLVDVAAFAEVTPAANQIEPPFRQQDAAHRAPPEPARHWR